MSADTAPITIYGESDDILVAETRAGIREEFDAYDGAELVIRHDDDALMIRASFTEHGVWAIAPTMLSEAHPLPDWDIVVDTRHDYSPGITIHAPENALIIPDR